MNSHYWNASRRPNAYIKNIIHRQNLFRDTSSAAAHCVYVQLYKYKYIHRGLIYTLSYALVAANDDPRYPSRHRQRLPPSRERQQPPAIHRSTPSPLLSAHPGPHDPAVYLTVSDHRSRDNDGGGVIATIGLRAALRGCYHIMLHNNNNNRISGRDCSVCVYPHKRCIIRRGRLFHILLVAYRGHAFPIATVAIAPYFRIRYTSFRDYRGSLFPHNAYTDHRTTLNCLNFN